MSQNDRTPNFTPISSSKMNQEPLKEKQLNTTLTLTSSSQTTQLKTPISYSSKYVANNAKKQQQPTSTKQATAKPTEENLTQSAKKRNLLTKLNAFNASVNQSNIQIASNASHSAHLSSHNNLPVFMNTPKRTINSSTNSNNNNGSAKLAAKENATNSATKKPTVSSSAKASIGATAAINSYTSNLISNSAKLTAAAAISKSALPTVIMNSSTPSNRNFPKSSAIKKPSEEALNPIVNGVDYSHMISMKPQLGYTGPGYIVEFNCEAKYLKGLTIGKGFWKVVAKETHARDPALAYLGPPISLTRIDTNDSNGAAKTPSKNPFSKFDFDFKPRFNTVAKSHDIASSLSSTSCLNLETKTKIKKTLRWADGLEPINESSGANSICSPATNATNTNTSSNGTPHQTHLLLSSSNDDSTKRKSLRKSFSLGDINDFILLHESDEENENQNHNSQQHQHQQQQMENHDDKYYLPLKFMSLNDDNSMVGNDLSLTHQHNNNNNNPNGTLDLEKNNYNYIMCDLIEANAKSSPCSQAQTPSFSFENSYRHQHQQPQVVVSHPTTTKLMDSSCDQYVTPKHNNLLQPQLSNDENVVKSLSIENLTETSKINSTEIECNQIIPDVMKMSHKIDETSAILSQSAIQQQQQQQQMKNETMTIETPKMTTSSKEFIEMRDLESVGDALQELIDKLLKNEELGQTLTELNVLKNKRTAKPKLKLKVNSSAEFLRWFSLLDTAETYIKFCKENLSQK